MEDLIHQLAHDWQVPVDALSAYIDNCYHNPTEDDIHNCRNEFFDAYMGEYEGAGDSAVMEDYAYSLMVDMFGEDNWFIKHQYADVTQFARDLNYDGYWVHSNHVFAPV